MGPPTSTRETASVANHDAKCERTKEEDKFSSTVTGKSYRVKATASCKMSNVVYLIECHQCRKQYVGEMENPFHKQMNGHRSDIRHRQMDKPVAEHFKGAIISKIKKIFFVCKITFIMTSSL